MNHVESISSCTSAFNNMRLRALKVRNLALCLSSIGLVQAAFPTYAAPQIRTVLNCDDSGADSLRDIVTNPNSPHYAQSGDTVDLSQLPTLCGMADSSITLSNGQIVVNQDDLTLIGPIEMDRSVTISGDNASRVLKHEGLGTLELRSLTIANGTYHLYGVPGDGYGGCIESMGALSLNRTTVTHCDVKTNTGAGGGGGIHAPSVMLILSRVSDSYEWVQGQGSCGGGVHANTLIAKYSSLSHNHGVGGGGACAHNITIIGSTIDNNSASDGGALQTDGSATIRNSTISGNAATFGSAINALGSTLSVAIDNSTIVFNSSYDMAGGAVYFDGGAADVLTLQSSIIAKNTAGPSNSPADIFISPGHGLLDNAGADNLVIAANVPSPPGVITVITDPKLGPLQFNGGWNQTHALLPGSPALGMGNNTASLTNDQRGSGYPRTTGPKASVDIGSFQFDTIFANGFGWPD